MAQTKNGIQIVQENGSLFVRAGEAILQNSNQKRVEGILAHPKLHKVVLQLLPDGTCLDSTIFDLTDLILKNPALTARIVKRSKPIFSQRPDEKDKKIRHIHLGPNTRVCSCAYDFNYSGKLPEMYSPTMRHILTILKTDQPTYVNFQFSGLPKESVEEFYVRSQQIRNAFFKEIKCMPNISSFQFNYIHHEKFFCIEKFDRFNGRLEKDEKASLTLPTIQDSAIISNTTPKPTNEPVEMPHIITKPLSRYQKRLEKRARELTNNK